MKQSTSEITREYESESKRRLRDNESGGENESVRVRAKGD